MGQDDQPTRSPAQVAPSGVPGLNGLLSLAVAVVVVAALYFGREVLIPITVAVILSFMLVPLVTRLKHWHVPHVAAVLLALLVGLGVVGLVGGIIGTQVASIAQDIPQYTATITRRVHVVKEMTTGRLSGPTERLDRTMERTAKEANAAQTGVPADETPKAQLAQVQPPPTSAMELARTVLAPSSIHCRRCSSSC